MNKTEINTILSSLLMSKDESNAENKKTTLGTWHVGDLNGNRTGNGPLRSQFIVCETQKIWDNSKETSRKSLHSDQRVFVQVGDDVWDVYSGTDLVSESNNPKIVVQNGHGLQKLLLEAKKELLGASVGINMDDKPLQRIFYGAPGTGKSFHTDKVIKDKKYSDTIRVTFHPDSDYASFVGCYKPTMRSKKRIALVGKKFEEGDVSSLDESLQKDDVIVYEFVPQAFTKTYELAWRKMAEATADEPPAPQFLVVEEINRGNCAQIFGDLFQLLDRDDNGYSKYPVDPDADLAKHLHDWFRNKSTDKKGDEHPAVVSGSDGDKWKSRKAGTDETNTTWDDVLSGRKLVLPPNLYIWATMNTSDQSLFPMDSAFKRRWDWEYVPITDAKKGWAIVAGKKRFDWWTFLEKANEAIRSATGSEDKELGYFFVKPPEGSTEISAKTFVDKVLFYLFGDAFKDDTPPLSLFPEKADGSAPWKLRDFRTYVLEDGGAKSKPNEENLAIWLEQIKIEPPKKTDLGADGGAGATGGDDATPAGSDGVASSPQVRPVEAIKPWGKPLSSPSPTQQ